MDAEIPDTLGAYLATDTYYSIVRTGPDLFAFAADSPRAYKHVGIPARQSGLPATLLAPPEGPLRVATLRTQPFGSARAPANWGRVAKFTQLAIERIFGIIVILYVGAWFFTEMVPTAQSQHERFNATCELLGFSLTPSKAQGPAKSLRLLGADIARHPGRASDRLPERLRGDLISDFHQVRSYDQINPAQAAKLRGRLGFAQSLLFGRVGRALLQPFADRQHARLFGRGFP